MKIKLAILLGFPSYPDEKVNHEEYVEGQIDLLGAIRGPGFTALHTDAGKELKH